MKLPVLLYWIFATYGCWFAIGKSLKAGDPIGTKLKLVATVDGKSFFADRAVYRNWTAAGKFCEDLGMELASITSKAQADALRAAYSSTDFYLDYWISGRDSQQRRQFTWNATGDAVSEDLPYFENPFDLPYQTCMLFYSLPNNESIVYYWTCSSTTGTLCST